MSDRDDLMNDAEAITALSGYVETIRNYGKGLRDSLPNYSNCLINISIEMEECLKILERSVRCLKEYKRQESLYLNGLEDDVPFPESW